MSLWKIAWRSIQQRSVASALTAFSVSLGVALVIAVLVIHSVVDRSFRRGAQGYDLIVGAKGSSLQLVLDTVFYLGEPVDTIPYSYYREFTEGRFVPAVQTAIPICTGHQYRGFRVVATVPEMFEELTYLNDQHYEFLHGRNFKRENPFEAVVGYRAALATGLKVGDKFRPTVAETSQSDESHQDEPFVVVGILKPTGTPNDRAIFINLEGFFRCKAHTAAPTFEEKLLKKSQFRVTDTNPTAENTDNGDNTQSASQQTDTATTDHEDEDHQRRLSAILVVTRLDEDPQLAMTLPEVINNEPYAQAVAPAKVIAELFDGIVGNVQKVLLILAVLVVIVAGVGILVSIYNSMSERRREIAIMRALGASRATVMSVILIESILLSLGGGLFGILLGHGLVGALAPTIARETGVVVSPLNFQLTELIVIPGLIVLATIVGYLPALAAYRTDVAKALADAP